MAVFFKCVKRRKYEKMKKISDFLKAHIPGMAGMIYFKPGTWSPLICEHLHSKFGLVWRSQ